MSAAMRVASPEMMAVYWKGRWRLRGAEMRELDERLAVARRVASQVEDVAAIAADALTDYLRILAEASEAADPSNAAAEIQDVRDVLRAFDPDAQHCEGCSKAFAADEAGGGGDDCWFCEQCLARMNAEIAACQPHDWSAGYEIEEAHCTKCGALREFVEAGEAAAAAIPGAVA